MYDAILKNQAQGNADRKEFSNAINLNTKNVVKVKSAIKTMQANLEAQGRDKSDINNRWMNFLSKVMDTQSDLANTIKVSTRTIQIGQKMNRRIIRTSQRMMKQIFDMDFNLRSMIKDIEKQNEIIGSLEAQKRTLIALVAGLKMSISDLGMQDRKMLLKSLRIQFEKNQYNVQKLEQIRKLIQNGGVNDFLS